MNVFAQDLINQNSSSSTSSSSISTSSSIATSTQDQLQSILNLDVTILDRIVTSVNLFALAWSIFYSYYFLIQFFQYRIIGAKGKVSDEVNGMAGIYPLLTMWWRYIGCLVLLVIYGLTRSTELGIPIGVVTILVFIIKIYIDLMKILGLFNYFNWSKNFAKNIKTRLKWKD